MPVRIPVAWCLLLLAQKHYALAAVSIASMWQETSRVLIIGEQHSAASHSRIVRGSLPQLKEKGMRHLCLEIPAAKHRALDEFIAEKRTTDWLSRQLWGSGEKTLPEAYWQKLQIISWCRENGVRVWPIDGDRSLLHKIASCQLLAVEGGIRSYVDVDGEAEVLRYGIAQSVRHYSPKEAEKIGWKLWLNGRTRYMAEAVAQIADQNESDRIVVLVGNAHVDLGAFRPLFEDQVADLSEVVDDGMEIYFADVIRDRSQSISLQGGFEVSGQIELLPRTKQVTAVEAHLIKSGFASQTVSIARVSGYRTIDSVVFLPISENPVP